MTRCASHCSRLRFDTMERHNGERTATTRARQIPGNMRRLRIVHRKPCCHVASDSISESFAFRGSHYSQGLDLTYPVSWPRSIVITLVTRTEVLCPCPRPS